MDPGIAQKWYCTFQGASKKFAAEPFHMTTTDPVDTGNIHV
jgi:hypothetical protein